MSLGFRGRNSRDNHAPNVGTVFAMSQGMATTNLQVAETILKQLGGAGRVTAMLGAKAFLGDERKLCFRFAAKATNGANHVDIRLEDNDTYTVTFTHVGRAPHYTCATKGEVSMVFADNLRQVFESETGLLLSL